MISLYFCTVFRPMQGKLGFHGEKSVKKTVFAACRRLEVLILHLLKCQFQPSKRSGSWLGMIDEQRSRLEDRLEDSPSLHQLIPEYVDAVYARAARHAASETGLPRATFPESLPYTIAQLLDESFLP